MTVPNPLMASLTTDPGPEDMEKLVQIQDGDVLMKSRMDVSHT